MKRLNLIIITTVIASLAMSLVFIEPTTTQASSGVLPNATPSPRRRPTTIQSPVKMKSPKVRKDSGDAHLDYVVGGKPNTKQSRKSRSRGSIYSSNPAGGLLGVRKVKAKSATSADGRSMDFEIRRKQRRKRKN